MRIRIPVISLALMAMMVACSKPSPVANGANAVMGVPPAADHASAKPAGGPPANTSGAAAAAPAPQATTSIAIPAEFQGRWGLTPRDCTTALGDAKGLLVINDHEMRFYESRAVPMADAHLTDSAFTGDFRFTGEGQTWTRFERLERQQNSLVRTEGDPTASFTYVKC
jgi:hypothetical protein